MVSQGVCGRAGGGILNVVIKVLMLGYNSLLMYRY